MLRSVRPAFLLLLFCSCGPALLFSQATTVLLSVVVTDVENGEALPYVGLSLPTADRSGTTDETGRLALRLPPGRYPLVSTFVGYRPDTTTVDLTDGPAHVRVGLLPVATRIGTVTVTANAARQRLERPLLGVERLTIRELTTIPVALGEVDVFRGLQHVSGVSSAGEASNGLSVRGGTVDQNLVLYDGAPVYTPTHLFGLFSVFTPDAVSGVSLYRANIPARYGGRLASVMSVDVRTPSADSFAMQGGIGLVSSRLSIETPLTKNRNLKLLAAGRLGLNDFLFGLSERLRNTRARFGDATLKLRYQLTENHSLSLTGFYARDFYQIDLLNSFGSILARANQYDYRTLNGTANWLWLTGERSSVLTRLVRADHQPRVLFPEVNSDNTVTYGQRIRTHHLESHLSYRSLTGHRLAGGVQFVRYDLDPGRLDPGTAVDLNPVNLAPERALEMTAYAEDEWSLGSALVLSGGLRYTLFSSLGPGQRRRYRPGQDVRPDNLLATEDVNRGERLSTFSGWEPRLGLSLRLGDRSRLKAAYAITRQYLQNIYNSTTPLPTSRWLLSDHNIGPQRAELASLGFYRVLGQQGLEMSLEVYGRRTMNLLEYRAGAEFFLNPAVETDVVQGRGRAYGFELGLKKTSGKVTARVNYAYARVFNRVRGSTFLASINRGEWYPGYFDQPHTFNGILGVNGKRNTLGFTLVVQSNRPYSVPNGIVQIDEARLPIFLERNNDRLPLYHRLDFNWTLHNFTLKKRRWVGDWTVTVYNLYGRKNAYNIFYQPRANSIGDEAVFGDSPLASYKLSIFANPVVSLSYNFTFR